MMFPIVGHDSASPSTVAGRIDAELKDAHKFRKKNPRLFWLLVAAAVVAGGVMAYDKFYGIPELKQTIEGKDTEIRVKDAKIHLLETQLSPIKTAAILKYGNSDAKSMALLAEDLKRVETAIREVDRKIRQLSIDVEVEYETRWKGGKPPLPTEWRPTAIRNSDFKVVLVFDDGREITVPFHGSMDIRIDPMEGNFVRLGYTAGAVEGTEICASPGKTDMW